MERLATLPDFLIALWFWWICATILFTGLWWATRARSTDVEETWQIITNDFVALERSEIFVEWDSVRIVRNEPDFCVVQLERDLFEEDE